MRKIILPIIIIIINSCAYRIETRTTSDNKKVRIRSYKNPYRQEAFENKRLFNRLYYKMIFEKYVGEIHRDTTNDLTFFQFDTTRIYIDNFPVDGNKGLTYSDLIKSGLIYPKIIACALNSDCVIPQDSIQQMISRRDTITFTGDFLVLDKFFLTEKYNWTGSKIYISNIKELPYLEKKKTRVFELEHKVFHGGPTDTYYYIEITNDKADKKTSLSNFVKGAKLTFFKYTHTDIEI